MPHIAAMPRYRTLGVSTAAVMLLTVGIWALDLQIGHDIPSVRLLVTHLVLVSLWVFCACVAARLYLNWRFEDVALQIDDIGIYVEGVTRVPVKWATITAVTDRKRYVTFRTTDKAALIHFALHRACFGRVGGGTPREVIINTGLIDLPAGEAHRAIARGIERYGKGEAAAPSPDLLSEAERKKMWARPTPPAAPEIHP